MSGPERVTIVEEVRRLEEEIERTNQAAEHCASELRHLSERLERVEEATTEAVALARQHLEEMRAARKARHTCIEGALGSLSRAVELFFGDPWVRRGLVLCFVVGALSVAGYGLVYNDDGFVIGGGHDESASEENAHERAREASESLPVNPTPMP